MGFGPPQQSGPSYTYDNQYKNDVGFQNRNSYGGVVGGADAAVNRYRAMGDAGANRAAPGQDFSQSDWDRYASGEARNQQMSALDLQRLAATGQAPSRAEILGQHMADDAVSAGQSMAAGTTGGPAQQAAAARAAAAGAGATMQRSANDIAGLRADEMARARDAYMGGATGIRQGDFTSEGLGLQRTGMQTQNEQFQRGLNQQDQQFYEQQAGHVNDAQLAANQGAQGQANQMSQASIGNAQQSSDFGWGKIMQVGGAVAGAASGGLGLAASDVREKENVMPMARSRPMGSLPPWMPPHTYPVVLLTSDRHAKQEARELGQQEGMQAAQDAGVHYGYFPENGMRAPASPASLGHRSEGPPSMGDAAAAQYDATHKVPYALASSNAEEAAKIRAGFGQPMGATAGMPAQDPGALGRIGGAFGGISRSLAPQRPYMSDPDAKDGLTPLSQATGTMRMGPGGGLDVMGSLRATNAADTQFLHRPGSGPSSMMANPLHISDPRAKREAFAMGAEYAVAAQRGTPPPMPEWAQQLREVPAPRPAETSGARRLEVTRPATGPAMTRSQPWQSDDAPPPQASPPAEMMDAIGPGKTFKYKPGVPDEDPNQQHFGTTTQDLRKTPMGSSMVVTDPRTGYEAIDTREAVGPTLAALGNLNQRMRSLELEKPLRPRRKQ